MKRFWLATSVMLLALAGHASAAAFQNGGFELGTAPGNPYDPCNDALPVGSTNMTGWTVIAGNVDWTSSTCGWAASEGTRSLDLVGTGTVGGVQQPFDTVAGATYRVSFDLAGNYGASPSVKPVTVTVAGISRTFTFDTTGHNATNMGWVRPTFTFVANGTSATISFVSDVTGSGTLGGAAIDNVSIVQTLAPFDNVAQIAAGGRHTCALVSGGAVWCWGYNYHGQLGNGAPTQITRPNASPINVTGLSAPVTAVASGSDHTCALLGTGSVQCWGKNSVGQLGNGAIANGNPTPVDVTGLSGVTALAAGADHTCAVVSGGAVMCWGENSLGQLGDGTTTSRTTPANVSSLSGVIALAAGNGHTCALSSGGTVWCWGSNVWGSLGNGTTTNSTTPVIVSGLMGVTALATAAATTCALINGGPSGTVRCWGMGQDGQIGSSAAVATQTTPITVDGLSGVIALAAGGTGLHMCAAMNTGAVMCWGYNAEGELGDGTTTNRFTPVMAQGVTGSVTSVAAGGSHTCALTSGGTVQCWGQNTWGELGDGVISAAQTTPVSTLGLSAPLTGIAAGSHHTCSSTSAKVECWGFNRYGQLGNGSISEVRALPVGVTGIGGTVSLLSSGSYHTCALISGQLQCWGNNVSGQLGTGDHTNRTAPVTVTGLGNVTSVVGGYGHTCALISDGSVRCWGRNSEGALGDGTATERTTPVAVVSLSGVVTALAAGEFHTCALMSTGAVQCWGSNNDGQLGSGNSVSSLNPVNVVNLGGTATALAAGGNHTCAVMSGGSAKCWGRGDSGELGNGLGSSSTVPVNVAGLTGVTALAAGYSHTCALTNAGQVRCWGWNMDGQLGDGTNTSSVWTPSNIVALSGQATALAVGDHHGCALITGGAVQCWGYNYYGQLGNGTSNFYTAATTVGLPVSSRAATTTFLASWVNPATAGASVTFAATVTGSAPSGTVTFTAGAATVCSSVPFSAGAGNTRTATCASSNLQITSGISVIATYSGDSSNLPSTSNSVNQVISGVVPGAPTGVTATAGNASITVTFTAPATIGSSPITSYTATCGAQSGVGPASPIIVGGMTNGNAYTCTVTATNAVGPGPSSLASNSVTPTIATLPGAPTHVTTTAGNQLVSVSFWPPASDGRSPILSYSAKCGTISSSGTSSPIAVAGLTNGATYSCTVSATNVVGTGPVSAPSNSVSPGLLTLATPTLIRAMPAGPGPLLIGRADGAVNTPIGVQLVTGTSCTNGVLGGTITTVSNSSATTDANGYFGTQQSTSQGQYVAVKVTNSQYSPPRVTALSNCVISAADNDTWPKALPLTGNGETVPDWIDAAGKARWYRINITPGQSVQVTLSGLPADYDLAVFKDIAVEFRNELVPVNTVDLTRLTAQYAPSAFSPTAFSPTAFSPTAFSPSAFSPTAFSPTAFSPSAFSPTAFSPTAFSPSAFSPSAFSPTAFSPTAFSPTAFSPTAFSPTAFSPTAFSPTELQQAFAAAQTRTILATSMTPGTGNESVVVNTWNNIGDFYVRVTGRAGAFSPNSYNVSVSKQGTSCVNVTDTRISSRGAATAGGYNTIIMVDGSKTPLSAPVPGQPSDNTLRDKLNNFAARSDINGVVVDVGTDDRVGALKTQAGGSNSGCPFAKNLVALEIRSIIDSYRMTNPLKYVVIVGSDDAIPFFRYPDQTLLGRESGFVPPVNSSSASEASLRGNYVLSQDHYGSTNSISFGASEFPIPGLAVGRLLETPAEIAGMIDAYVAANGSITPSSSLVTGYDFLEDAAKAVRAELQAGIGNERDDALITPNTVSPADTLAHPNGPWTAGDLRDKLLNARHDVMFLGGHFSANSALAADFKTSVFSWELGSGNFANSLVFSAGCHSGYNIVDSDAITGVTVPLDWAQAWAQQKTTLIAGTGYQYGDTEFLEYSERLYLNFAKELRSGTGKVAVGEALVKAKLAYLNATPDMRGLHEKAVLEATLFGLPMFGVNMPHGRTTPSNTVAAIAPAAPPAGPAASLGLRVADINVKAALATKTLSLKNYEAQPPTSITATWLEGPDGVVTNPAEPALPLKIVNVTPTTPALVLRGVGFRGASYSDSTVVPLTGAPTTEIRGVHTPFSSPLFFPMRLWTTNYFGALSNAGGTSLLMMPAQHKSLPGSLFSVLRQYSSLDVRLFYSDLTAASNPALAKAVLSAAPTIVSVGATISGGNATFSAQVVGDPAAAIHEVWITYTNGAGGNGTWTSFNLQQCVVPLPTACGNNADSRIWKAQVARATLPADTRYVVQAVNGVGLVSFDDNFGTYYSLVSTPAAATAIAFSPQPPSSVPFGDSVQISAVLSAGGSPLADKVVTIAAGSSARVASTDASGAVTVQVPVLGAPGSYPVTATFSGEASYLPSSVSASSPITVTRAAATLTVHPQGSGALLTAGSRPLIQESVEFVLNVPTGPPQHLFAITDYAGVATVPLTSGTYAIAQACFAGSTTHAATKLNANASCTIAANVPPVISSVTGPVGPVPKNTAVAITANFSDVEQEPHTCTFAWNDGSSETVSTATGISSCTLPHKYSAAGLYEPRVSVRDADTTFAATSSVRYVVVYDPTAGYVTGSGSINSPIGAYVADPSLTGKVNFSFVSKYQSGQSVPTGDTEFTVGSIKFVSTSYEWLVVSGAKAQYKGSATINGAGSYNFTLTAWDGKVSGGGGVDRLRIKIYDINQGNKLIYDNQPGAPDNADPTMAIGGGSVVIRK